MNLGAFVSSLGAALMSRLSSVGAAVAAGFATIVMSFTADQRTILADVKLKFHTVLQEQVAAGDSEVDAIEKAATAAYNTFCAEENGEFVKEASALITLLESAAKSAAGIVGSVITGGVAKVLPASAEG